MNALTFRIELLEPVLVSQAESGEENSAIGLPFVPGSALRGACVARYLEQHGGVNLATDDDARRLFLDGTVRFLNAYPCPADERMLPTPLSWFAEKAQAGDLEGPCYDLAVDPERALKLAKGVTWPFCHITYQRVQSEEEEWGDEAAGQGRSECLVHLHRPLVQMNVHILLENPNERGEENTVYRYDALAEGQTFAGAVVAEDANDLMIIQTLLQDAELRLGSALSAGYGQTRVDRAGIETNWQEYAAGAPLPDGQVVVTLLGDAILRGADGQVGADPGGALAAALGLPNMRWTGQFRHVRPVGGFNRKWSLPLVQAWAVQAGSVFVGKVNDGDLAALQHAAENGIGERRAEGFGRLALNWHTASAPQRVRLPAARPAGYTLSEDSQKQASKMAQRQLRLLLERKLVEAVNAVGVDASRAPQNAQLSRVRTVAQQALLQGGSVQGGTLDLVLRHLEDLKGAKEQFERVRVMRGTTPGPTLYEWIEQRAQRRDVQEYILQSPLSLTVAGVKADLTSELRTEFSARLIDAVMKKVTKERQEAVRQQSRKEAQ
jgi:CRISPR-associated protein Csx10